MTLPPASGFPVKSALLKGYDLQIREVKGRGRAIFATKRFQPGDIVLESNPYTWVAAAERQQSTCNRCLKDSNSLKRCSTCKSAWFCDRSCQLAAWKHHKRVCFKSETDWLQSETNTAKDEARILDIVLELADSGFGLHKENTIPRPSTADVEAMPHATRPTALDYVLAGVVIDRQRDRCIAKNVTPSHRTVDEVVKMIVRMKCNNFSIWNELLVPVGSGCYPAGALLNHSCEPDCIITYDLDTKVQTFRAIKTIEPGCEVTHSYLDIAEATSQRREYLLHHYGFECACPRCEAADQTLNDSLHAAISSEAAGDWTGCDSQRLDAAKQLIAKVANGELDLEETGREIEMLENALSMHTKYLHRHNLHRLKCLCTLHTSYLSYGLFAKDVAVLNEIVHVYTEVYPTNHPMIGLMQYTLGDVLMAVAQEQRGQQLRTTFEAALVSYRRALQTLTISHGAESELCRNLHGLIQQHSYSP
ncbi:hypothetical protein SARC_01700 [Sphaeroforma arctica JP610]|uniref:MYND-type domain-containing protein n=1 Tax=Sphaeroforma arctica JP610 TaxID=667725 RepID=A0A0L0GB68_9EUKA|nr:hypothetical protein SARC_01700 [Sphaeroforma arctica JP610]KNC86131.1 hypothetical protein SARC_01700 [Sphaeroforma arctica JP610]|eukprot:XP_014160033.1 hypothetical protein SARC_01700 [Sphaeroforma arctica JP610]